MKRLAVIFAFLAIMHFISAQERTVAVAHEKEEHSFLIFNASPVAESASAIILHHNGQEAHALKEGQKIGFVMKPTGRNAQPGKQNHYEGIYLGVDSGFVKVQITKVKSAWELKVDDKNAIVRMLPSQLDWIEVKRKKYYRQGSGNTKRYWTIESVKERK